MDTHSHPAPLPRFLSIAAAAAYMCISERQFHYLRDRYGIPYCQPGGRGNMVRFDTNDLDQFMHEHRICPPSKSDTNKEARELAR